MIHFKTFAYTYIYIYILFFSKPGFLHQKIPQKSNQKIAWKKVCGHQLIPIFEQKTQRVTRKLAKGYVEIGRCPRSCCCGISVFPLEVCRVCRNAMDGDDWQNTSAVKTSDRMESMKCLDVGCEAKGF